ncbi:MAG: hypothetical protein ACEQSA_03940 [Weeksellaceae bacterium]
MNTVPTIFGQISPPPGPDIYQNPIAGLSMLLTFGIRMFLIVGMIAVLFYLLWGAFDWITAGGDKDKIDSARSKMTNSVLGIILMVIALGIFSVVSGDVLGIIKRDPNGNWVFGVPRIGP